MDIDLDIENYDFNDLLKLFNIDYNFSEYDLKQCYKTVLKTHPDKSGLNKEYFLFYTKAFKILKNIFEYKNKKLDCIDRIKCKTEYLAINEDDAGKKLLVEKLQKKKAGDFNKWFNETFEKINIKNDCNNGYGHWFKSDEDINDKNIKSINQLHENINIKKESLSKLAKINNIDDFNSMGNNNELDIEQPVSFSANVFSKLQYDDLKKAHTETVIPVCDKDYMKIKKFNNISSLRDFRNNQDISPMSKIDAEKTLNKNYNNLDYKNTQLAYKLTKQAEAAERSNAILWNTIRTIK